MQLISNSLLSNNLLSEIPSIQFKLILAIKYLVAAPSEKADIKKSAIPYAVAAVILFTAVNILAVIQEWSQDLNLI